MSLEQKPGYWVSFQVSFACINSLEKPPLGIPQSCCICISKAESVR